MQNGLPRINPARSSLVFIRQNLELVGTHWKMKIDIFLSQIWQKFGSIYLFWKARIGVRNLIQYPFDFEKLNVFLNFYWPNIIWSKNISTISPVFYQLIFRKKNISWLLFYQAGFVMATTGPGFTRGLDLYPEKITEFGSSSGTLDSNRIKVARPSLFIHS